MSSARLLELMNEGGADGGGTCGAATGVEYGKVVDDMGTGVETGGGVGRGGITLWDICSDTDTRTSWSSFSDNFPVSKIFFRLWREESFVLAA
jgi:hypothetical protein